MKRGQFLMKNRKGLSDVLATLIIILLVLVAAGIVWLVVRNVVERQSGQVDLGARCLEVEVRLVGVVETTTPGNYSVSLRRESGGDAIGGIDVVLLNATDSSATPLPFGTLSPGQERNVTLGPTITGATRIDFTPYFLDASQNKLFCATQRQTFRTA